MSKLCHDFDVYGISRSLNCRDFLPTRERVLSVDDLHIVLNTLAQVILHAVSQVRYAPS